MENDLSALLTKVFSETLERVAFMFADPVEMEELVPADEALLEVRMRFHGEICGTLRLFVPAPMTHELAANMLGAEPDDPDVEKKANDAVKELLNVCCGRVTTELAGDAPVFDLTVPEVVEATTETWEDLAAQEGSAGFQIDDYAVLLNIEVETANA